MAELKICSPARRVALFNKFLSYGRKSVRNKDGSFVAFFLSLLP